MLLFSLKEYPFSHLRYLILNFLQLMITKEGELNLNFEDDLVLGTCITDNKQIVHDRVREMIN